MHSGFSSALKTLLFLFVLGACKHPDDNPEKPVAEFESTPEQISFPPNLIDEASGMAHSKNLPGYVWVHQDSQAPASVYLLSQDGNVLKEYPLPGTHNRDWEDMASGPGPDPGAHYLYIGDIGNNNTPSQSEFTIYRVRELSSIQQLAYSPEDVETLRFRYPDGQHDSETLLVDPVTKDLYIVSKETQQAQLYRLAYPQSTTEVMTAEWLGTLPFVALATSGDISKNGDEILIRTYLSVYYWKKRANQTIGQALTATAQKQLAVELEPQGEAICFDANAAGFYTLSERRAGSTPVTLNYYKRK